MSYMRLFAEGEEGKEKLLKDLSSIKKFITYLDKELGEYNGYKMNGERISLKEFIPHYDKMVTYVKNNIVYDEEKSFMVLKNLAQFPHANNDLEEGEVEFENSISVNQAFEEDELQSIFIQFEVDRYLEDFKDKIKDYGYGVFGDLYDDESWNTYIEFNL